MIRKIRMALGSFWLTSDEDDEDEYKGTCYVVNAIGIVVTIEILAIVFMIGCGIIQLIFT